MLHIKIRTPMNLNRLIRVYLLLLFALLQCVAPLAHAHVNGDSADQKVHLATIESSWLNAHEHDFHAEQFAAELAHSAVVTMPPEYRFNDIAVVQVSGASVEPLLALRVYSAPLFVAPPPQSIAFLPYQLPCSQAPPVKIIPVKIIPVNIV